MQEQEKDAEVVDVQPSQDMLKQIFEMQSELADLTFISNDQRDTEGNTLTIQHIADEARDGKLRSGQLLNHWLRSMAQAIKHEVEEVDEVLPWKYWAKDSIGEKKFAQKWAQKHPGVPPPPLSETSQQRVNDVAIEFIDILHFTIEALIMCGKSAEDIYNIYKAKWEVNKQRQHNNYKVCTKTEEDNDRIAKEV